MSLLIKNGTIVTAADFYKGDVLIEGERISTIGSSLNRISESSAKRSGERTASIDCLIARCRSSDPQAAQRGGRPALLSRPNGPAANLL